MILISRGLIHLQMFRDVQIRAQQSLNANFLSMVLALTKVTAIRRKHQVRLVLRDLERMSMISMS